MSGQTNKHKPKPKNQRQPHIWVDIVSIMTLDFKIGQTQNSYVYKNIAMYSWHFEFMKQI